nr:MAG TPA: DNA-directed RNA polymerase subunit alpha [Caudoviricetes sp.]
MVTYSSLINDIRVTTLYEYKYGTQVSGYMAKQLLAAFQSEYLGPKDSDCGSTKYLEVKMTKGNVNNFINRYVLNGSKLTEITNRNKEQLIGKTVKMRSPLYCKGYGKDKCICNACGGNYYYNMENTEIGLLASICGTDLTQANLQKFHQNLVLTKQLNPDELLM